MLRHMAGQHETRSSFFAERADVPEPFLVDVPIAKCRVAGVKLSALHLKSSVVLKLKSQVPSPLAEVRTGAGLSTVGDALSAPFHS